jgi:hypothetical protein
VTRSGRDAIDVDALRTDRYLEALLAAGERHATDAPADSRLDPAIRAAAFRLQRELVRIHPSFRFEERVAAKLASIAHGMRMPAAAGAEGRLVPFGAHGDPADTSIDPAAHPAADLLAEHPESDGGHVRPLLIGGAMASAALSIAGAAFVAWWRLRPPPTPMGRAVRAARQLRVGRQSSISGTRRGSRQGMGLH